MFVRLVVEDQQGLKERYKFKIVFVEVIDRLFTKKKESKDSIKMLVQVKRRRVVFLVDGVRKKWGLGGCKEDVEFFILV